MQEDDFFNDLDFKSLRDNRVETKPDKWHAMLFDASIKGQIVFELQDGDTLTLYTKGKYVEIESQKGNFDVPHDDFVLVGDEFIEGINDPDELEDALNSWGVY